MARHKKGKKSKPESQGTQTAAVSSKPRIGTKTAAAPRDGTAAGSASGDSHAAGLLFVDDPESIVRKSRKARKAKATAQVQDQPKSRTRIQPDDLVQSIETALEEVQHQRNENYLSDEGADDTSSILRANTDPEEAFNNKWGYLPPLDEEAVVVAVIDAIVADPSMAKELARVGPYHEDFSYGLRCRNVSLNESKAPDIYADHIQRLETQQALLETKEERHSYLHLWNLDQEKCGEGSNEALFQRTLMMSLIARHCLIYDGGAASQRFLDFNVEQPWSCPPMPTRAYETNEKFLTQPKPDVAVSFLREQFLPDSLWFDLPKATRRLACHESLDETERTRIFPFFTIEGKKATTSTNDRVGKHQSLNNASQALHNMFESCRDAGPEHEKIFFEKIRFFSAVASNEGMIIRIHRATRQPGDGSGPGLIMKDRPDYPLIFEHRRFCDIPKDDFNRPRVLEMLERILLGYGVKELRLLLQEAAKALLTKLTDNLTARLERVNGDYYRYGQIIKPPPRSQTQTPATARAPPTQDYIPQIRTTMEPSPPRRAPSESQSSPNMPRSGNKKPRQTQRAAPIQSPNRTGKRGRSQLEDTGPIRNTRKRE